MDDAYHLIDSSKDQALFTFGITLAEGCEVSRCRVQVFRFRVRQSGVEF